MTEIATSWCSCGVIHNLKTYEYRHPRLIHPWITREVTEAGALELFSIIWSEQSETLPTGATFAEGRIVER